MLARLHEDDTVATFYEQRLPPRLRTVFAEWLALQPERNRAAPPHPFALPSYTIPDAEAARRQTERSDEQDYQALRASHISGRYTRTTVSFALVLFFAGLAPRGVRRQSRLLMLALSIAFLSDRRTDHRHLAGADLNQNSICAPGRVSALSVRRK